jgi:inhibitor of cysteine peptidase
MKPMKPASLALALAVALLAACGSTSAAPKVEVSCDTFGAQPTPFTYTADPIELAPGDTLTLSLCSNPTTGYSWADEVTFDDAVLSLTGRSFEEGADTDPPVVGGPGREALTFEATGSGTTTIEMTYVRPFEPDSTPAWTFRLEVDVR